MEKNAESYRWLILLGLNITYLVLISQLNFTLSNWSIYLFLNAIFIVYPALYIPTSHGFATTVLISLFYDASEPWGFGTSLLPNLIAFFVFINLRRRIRHQQKQVLRSSLLVLNLCLFCYYTLLAGLENGFSKNFFYLNLYHIFCSEIILFVIATWIIAQQAAALRLFNIYVPTFRATK